MMGKNPYRYFKRGMDFIFSLILLFILSPLFLLIYFALLIVNRGSVFFFQERPGFNENYFRLIKFKTMTDKKNPDGTLLPDSKRITKFGRFLRKSSMDEIPELINILNGDMSFVGPRPLLVSYLPYYTSEERIRHSVRPGLTGLAQVKGRNNLTWDRKLEYDREYVLNQSFLNDVYILLRTTVVVFSTRDILDHAPEGPLDKIRSKQI